PMGQHANTYLLLFSHPYLVESLLRDFVPGDWVRQLDFSTLEKVGASYATDDVRSRHDDLVWRVRGRPAGQWLYIYLLLEFQRRDEHFMAVRIMAYLALLYQDLIRQLDLGSGDTLPWVSPIVLYNGHVRWKAPTNLGDLLPEGPAGLEAFRPRVEYLLLDEGALLERALRTAANPVANLFRLEHAGPDEALAATRALRASLQGPRHRDLRRAFVVWYTGVLHRRLGSVELPELHHLEEVETMLEERAPMWTEIWEERGLERGLKRGREQGREQGQREGESKMLLRQLERRFGAPGTEVQRRVRSADADRLLEWGDRILTAERMEDVFGDA
ncbi:MAG: Rpn family recombination-promoting nuclease/putative transposase, partial [Acidobacteriota bacterium]